MTPIMAGWQSRLRIGTTKSQKADPQGRHYTMHHVVMTTHDKRSRHSVICDKQRQRRVRHQQWLSLTGGSECPVSYAVMPCHRKYFYYMGLQCAFSKNLCANCSGLIVITYYTWVKSIYCYLRTWKKVGYKSIFGFKSF